MKAIAIIPARGGSKRIPKKNIKLFLGKPIISYSIDAALSSKLFSEVMVSTDNEEIEDLALELGAKVPFKRSVENSSDVASTVEVLLEVIGEYEKSGLTFDYGCCIYPTAPFVTSQSFSRSLEMLVAGNYDSVFPILPFSHPIQRALKIFDGSKVQMLQPEFMTTRSQDLEKYFHDSGQYYWFNIARLKECKKLWMENSASIILGEMDAHDIDTEEDWRVAEFKYRLRHEKL